MKKLLINFFVLFVIISCTNENIDGESSTNPDEINNSQNPTNDKSGNIIIEDLFNYDNLVYIIGRTISNDVKARNYLINLNTKGFILKDELTNDNPFHIAFNRQLLHCLEGPYPATDNNARRPPSSDDNSASPKITWVDFYNFINSNCFEIYFARPISSHVQNDQKIYITRHPLADHPYKWPIGYELYRSINADQQESNEGSYLIFDDKLLENQLSDVIVVRPHRGSQRNCQYGDIDFNSFYNTTD